MTIFIIIPVHNRRTLTRACLLSLAEQTHGNFRAVVVDAGSTDGTGHMIAREFPDVVLVRGERDLWWTGATNKGIRHVMGICGPGDYVLVLNDDLVVPRDYVSNLARLAVNFPNTLIGSVVIDATDRDTVLSGGVRINWWNAKRHFLDVGIPRSSFPQGFYNEVSTLTGRGVLIPTSVFRELGLYNEKHYRHYGDIELPKRAEKAGYRLIVSYDAVVYSQPLRRNSLKESEKYGLSDARIYFCSTRSNADLRTRFWLAFDCSSNILQGTICLLFDLARITVHFIMRLSISEDAR